MGGVVDDADECGDAADAYLDVLPVLRRDAGLGFLYRGEGEADQGGGAANVGDVAVSELTSGGLPSRRCEGIGYPRQWREVVVAPPPVGIAPPTALGSMLFASARSGLINGVRDAVGLVDAQGS